MGIVSARISKFESLSLSRLVSPLDDQTTDRWPLSPNSTMCIEYSEGNEMVNNAFRLEKVILCRPNRR